MCDTLRAALPSNLEAMRAVARRILPAHEVDDAVQGACLSALCCNFRGQCAPKTFLYRLTVNSCLMRLRSKSKRREVDIDNARHCPARQEHNTEDRQWVRDIVAKIPQPYRQALELFYMQGRSLREIALFCNVSVNNAKARVFRARNMLREIRD